MRLRGYRDADRGLLTGHWLPGELLGVPLDDRPLLAEPATVPPPADGSEELCVAPGAGFVRFTELDWVHRRARLETGLLASPDAPELLLKAALEHGFTVLNLHRIYGWATPAADARTDVLEASGLRWEATVPQAVWFGGRPVDRQLWGVLDD